MKKNAHEQGFRRGFTLGLAVLLAVPGLSALAAEKKKKSQAQAPPQEELAWPLPPSPPRIRWVTQIAKFSDLQERKKKKRSWFGRIAGVKEVEEREMSLSRPYGIAVDSRSPNRSSSSKHMERCAVTYPQVSSNCRSGSSASSGQRPEYLCRTHWRNAQNSPCPRR